MCHADERQWRLVFDTHRPRRVEDQSEDERAPRADAVKHALQSVHNGSVAPVVRRMHMDIGLSAMDRLGSGRLTTSMTTNPFLIVTAAASITSAAVGGLFYAFSAFVMRGLDRTGPVDAITAMRGINAEAERNGPLLVLLFGSALLAIVAGVIAVAQWRQPGSGFSL